MKKDMPLEGLRWSRDSGSALYDTPQNGRSRTGWGAESLRIPSKLRNVSSDPQFEEWVVERYGISIHIYEIFSNQCLLDTLHIG